MSECVCQAGAYKLTYEGEQRSVAWSQSVTNQPMMNQSMINASQLASSNDSLAVEAAPYTCVPCTSAHEIQSVDMTDCSAPGVTIETLVLKPGFWRQSERARYVRTCPVGDNNQSCLGGSNTSEQCAPGYRGPLCNLCAENHYGGRGNTCNECQGNALFTVGGVIGGVVGAIVLVVTLLALCRKHVRKVITSATEVVDAAGSNLSSDLGSTDSAVSFSAVTSGMQAVVEEKATEAVEGRIQKRSRCMHRWYKVTKAVSEFDSFGVRLRILISLAQVVSQLDVVYSIQYPDAFKAMLRWLKQLNVSLNLLPVSCLMPWADGARPGYRLAIRSANRRACSRFDSQASSLISSLRLRCRLQR